MRHLLLLSGLALAGFAVADEKKGTKIELDGIASTTPADWVKEAPANKMRFAQFKLPRVKDDKDDALLVIFKGITGSSKQNIERWKGDFKAPAGKTIDDICKVTEIKVGDQPATRLDVSEGIFLFSAAPFAGGKKTEKPGYKMIAIQIDGPDNPYHIKLTGPAKTIDHYTKGFDEWIKGFKK